MSWLYWTMFACILLTIVGFALAYLFYVRMKKAENALKIKIYVDKLGKLKIGNKIYCSNTSSSEGFKLIKELGKGGQGVVYRVAKVSYPLITKGEGKTQERIALKIFAPNQFIFFQGENIVEEAKRRFIYEKLVQKIEHENIVKVNNFFEIIHNDNNKLHLPSYIMEIYEQSLRDYICKVGKSFKLENSILEDEQGTKIVLKYLIDVTEGLEHIHKQKIVHRDIKPSNIMLKQGKAAIADFGVAFWRDFVETHGEKTISIRTLDPQGTPNFMDPHVRVKKPIYKPSSDIYSLGVTLLNVFFCEFDKLEKEIGRTFIPSDIIYLRRMCKKLEKPKDRIGVIILDLAEIMCDPEQKRRPNVVEVRKKFEEIKTIVENPKRIEEIIGISEEKKKEVEKLYQVLQKTEDVKKRAETFKKLIANKETQFPKINLKNANLAFIKLIKFNMKDANLQFVNLQLAELQLANLELANLQGTDLRDANLKGANLKGANLQEAKLQGANLKGANLQGANLQGANLRKADLQRTNLQGTNLRKTGLQEANLRKANLQRSDLQMANLQETNLRKADLRESNLQLTNLQGADLQMADLENSDLQGAKMKNANLKGVNVKYTKIKAADLANVNTEEIINLEKLHFVT